MWFEPLKVKFRVVLFDCENSFMSDDLTNRRGCMGFVCRFSVIGYQLFGLLRVYGLTFLGKCVDSMKLGFFPCLD
jgi:hypothetical protein